MWPQLRPRRRRLRRERQPLLSPLRRLVHRSLRRHGAAVGAVGADPDRSHPIHGGLDLVGVERQRRRRRLRDLPRRRADRIDELARLHVRVAELRHDLQRRGRRLRRRRRPLRAWRRSSWPLPPAAATPQPPSVPQNQSIASVTETSFTDVLERSNRRRRRHRLRAVPRRREGRNDDRDELHLYGPHLRQDVHGRARGFRRRRQLVRPDSGDGACRDERVHAGRRHPGAVVAGQPHPGGRFADVGLGVLVGGVGQRRSCRLRLLPRRLARRERHRDELRVLGPHVRNGLLVRDRCLRRGREPLRQDLDLGDDECLLAASASATSAASASGPRRREPLGRHERRLLRAAGDAAAPTPTRRRAPGTRPTRRPRPAT